MEQDFALDCLYLKIVEQDYVLAHLAHLAHLNPGNQVAQTIEIAPFQWVDFTVPPLPLIYR